MSLLLAIIVTNSFQRLQGSGRELCVVHALSNLNFVTIPGKQEKLFALHRWRNKVQRSCPQSHRSKGRAGSPLWSALSVPFHANAASRWHCIKSAILYHRAGTRGKRGLVVRDPIWSQTALLASTFSSVTLGRIHNPSVPQFPYLKNGDNINTH